MSGETAFEKENNSSMSPWKKALEGAKAVKAQALVYEDIDGGKSEELYLELQLQEPVSNTLKAHADSCYLAMSDTKCTLRVPLFSEEMKYFYDNWEDYYYLPDEDTAIHVSVAEFVSRPNRKKATPSTCYTKVEGRFLREWEELFTPVFKRSHDDKALYFEVTDELKTDRAALAEYAVSVIRHILG